MCGRYANFSSTADVVAAFGIELLTRDLDPSWNVAPTQAVEVVVEDAAKAERLDQPIRRELTTARWGLVPSWAAALDSGPLLINARSETLTTKPSFRAAARHRRALLPANGYYEWQGGPGRSKRAFYLHPDGEEPLALAGVYEWWRPPQPPAGIPAAPPDQHGRTARPEPATAMAGEAGWLCSVAIVTRPATDALGHVHDRMPVVVPRALMEPWLDPLLVDPAEVRALLAAVPDPVLAPREVSRAVGSVRNNAPGLIAPVDAPPPTEEVPL